MISRRQFLAVIGTLPFLSHSAQAQPPALPTPSGGRLPTMAPDAELEPDFDPADVLPHPDRPGFTIRCRNCKVTNPGMWAEKAEGYRNTVWFDGTPACQQAQIRRQKILRFRELQRRTPTLDLPSDMGGPATRIVRVPNPSPPPPTLPSVVPNLDLATLIPDTWVQ